MPRKWEGYRCRLSGNTWSGGAKHRNWQMSTCLHFRISWSGMLTICPTRNRIIVPYFIIFFTQLQGVNFDLDTLAALTEKKTDDSILQNVLKEVSAECAPLAADSNRYVIFGVNATSIDEIHLYHNSFADATWPVNSSYVSTTNWLPAAMIPRKSMINELPEWFSHKSRYWKC